MSEHLLYPIPPSATSRSSSVGQRNDSEGIGKYKTVPPKTIKYKEKFIALRDTYDNITAKHEEHQRELELANARLAQLQAENDLLLDAMMLVAHNEPTLVPYLDPQPPAMMNEVDLNGHSHPNRYSVNGDAMEVNSDFFNTNMQVNGRHA